MLVPLEVRLRSYSFGPLPHGVYRSDPGVLPGPVLLVMEPVPAVVSKENHADPHNPPQVSISLSAIRMSCNASRGRSSGVLKPGEMCLVLGCPGSGCTTFLKAIANERSEYAGVSGEVLYAGIDASEMARRYTGEVVYNQEGQLRITCSIPVF